MGYYHIELSSFSRELCMIVLPWGKYDYLRLLMGLVNSPDIFQVKMSTLMDGLEFVRTLRRKSRLALRRTSRNDPTTGFRRLRVFTLRVCVRNPHDTTLSDCHSCLTVALLTVIDTTSR